MSKNRPSFIMLGGLPASGKSTYARQIEAPRNIVSSDSVREQLYGNESVQGSSADVFEIVHDKIIQILSENKNVVLDATNLSRKYRNHLLSKLRKFDVEKQYILLATHPDTCKERNATRNRTVPNYVSLLTWYRDWETDRKSTRLNSSHSAKSRMPSSA